ncbi:MAG TPA: response regulator [Burkholderiaceae bacterium]|jgi:signal transduction histidine kinase
MTDDQTRIQVLCVDDHSILRQGIATLLAVEPDMALVAEASNGREAIQQFRAHRPDVTLMDLQMPGMGGLDAIGAIRAEFPDARIIVLTTYVGDAQAQRALQAGACGYLLKNALHKELLDAIRAVHAGRKALPSEVSFELAVQATDEALTPAEISVLRFIAQGNAYPDIARALALSEETVESQVRNILSKLDAQDREYAATTELNREMVQTERAARHAAEAANRAKSQFLTGVSHELRTPLNGVLGYAQLLTMEGGLSARQERGLDTIRQSGEHLLALINDILDLARIEAGHAELNLAPVKLSGLLQSVVELMRVKADEKRLAFGFDAGTGLPEAVLADERQLRQVLLNLLGNAIKFTDKGTVSLRASTEPKDPKHVLLRLDVEDTGVGMRPDDLDRIFEPFEQVGDVQRRSGGTGLGLAITRALVNDMGGQVQVSSEFGVGTRFRLELPLALVQSAEAAARKVPGVVRYQGPVQRVLVVDDAAVNRTLMWDFLTSAGFEVAQAIDGSELLTVARSFRPDLILIDSVMPSVDGVEATRRLRQDAELGAVPVIAVSASASAEHRADCLRAGVNVFLAKPVSLEALRAHIGEQLGLQWIEPTARAD